MAEPRAQTMEDYCMPIDASQVSRGLLLADSTNFNIKYAVLSDLRNKPFYGNVTSDPWEYLARLHETHQRRYICQ